MSYESVLLTARASMEYDEFRFSSHGREFTSREQVSNFRQEDRFTISVIENVSRGSMRHDN